MAPSPLSSPSSRQQNPEAAKKVKTMMDQDSVRPGSEGRSARPAGPFDLASSQNHNHHQRQRQPFATSLPPYVQQFSNTTSFILNRIKGGSGGLDSALSNLSGSSTTHHSKDAYEDARFKVVQSLSRGLAPDALPLASSGLERLLVSSMGGTESAFASNTGLKRKREEDEDKDGGEEEEEVIDFSKNTIPLPVARPKADPDFLLKIEKRKQQQGGAHIEYQCCECQANFTKTNNALLTCTGCWRSWHQACMSPPNKDANPSRYIVCLPCEAEERAAEAEERAQRAEESRLRRKIDRMREKRLAALPDGITPAKAELVGFTARGAPDADKMEHFSKMKKTDALNMLSFCDQLKPGLLLDIMVSVSNRHPDLPIFDSPDWEVYASSAVPPSRPPPQPRGPKPRQHLQVPHKPRHGHTVAPSAAAVAAAATTTTSTNNKPKMKIKPIRIAPVKRPSKLSNVVEPEPESKPAPSTGAAPAAGGVTVGGGGAGAGTGADGPPPAYEEDDALPPTWPKPGQGLYAQLVPEPEDRGFLRDEDDEEAFSQFMVDRNGMQIVDGV